MSQNAMIKQDLQAVLYRVCVCVCEFRIPFLEFGEASEVPSTAVCSD